jgi:hypothetical protein
VRLSQAAHGLDGMHDRERLRDYTTTVCGAQTVCVTLARAAVGHSEYLSRAWRVGRTCSGVRSGW